MVQRSIDPRLEASYMGSRSSRRSPLVPFLTSYRLLIILLQIFFVHSVCNFSFFQNILPQGVYREICLVFLGRPLLFLPGWGGGPGNQYGYDFLSSVPGETCGRNGGRS